MYMFCRHEALPPTNINAEILNSLWVSFIINLKFYGNSCMNNWSLIRFLYLQCPDLAHKKQLAAYLLYHVYLSFNKPSFWQNLLVVNKVWGTNWQDWTMVWNCIFRGENYEECCWGMLVVAFLTSKMLNITL